MQTQIVTKQIFAIGDVVPLSGLYVCVPCGYTQQFLAGERFTTCEACLAGTAYGPDGYQDEASDFWEFIG